MHIERLYVSNVREVGDFSYDFRDARGGIRKWTILPKTAHDDSLVAALALACTGTRHAPELCKRWPRIAPSSGGPARIEFVLVRQTPAERGPSQSPRKAGGWRINASTEIVPMAAIESKLDDPSLRIRKPPIGSGNGGWLLLGYGPRIRAHSNSDVFDFADPHHRLKRIGSLFDEQARLTDPLAFLERLHRKGVLYEQDRSLKFITTLNRTLAVFLGMRPTGWLEKCHDFRADWRGLSRVQKTLVTVVLDAARHVLDGATHCKDPFELTGVAILNGLEDWCPSDWIRDFLELLDSLFPKLQFILTCSEAAQSAFPPGLSGTTLEIPVPPPLRKSVRVPRLPPGAVLLIDVDSQLPNLALMKLSTHFKSQGRRVVLARRDAPVRRVEAAFASCVFAFPQSARKIERLKLQYGSALQLGGSGVDIKLRLAPEIESLPADYSLYPELGDRAIGFLTRGCTLHCPFCIVPIKEGKPRIVSDLDSLLAGGRKKLILLDDNILSHPRAVPLMEEMLQRDLQVNFNQTLDVRMLTEETASLLRRIRCSNVRFTRQNYYFSLNNVRSLDLVRKKYELLKTAPGENVEFVCMYGFDTTLAEDVKRFQFLRTLPGAYVFVQRYRPVLGGPEADLSHYFGEDSDSQIDALVRVVFRQNMKSMEVYYRWLSLLFARQCGRVHAGLLETLYRYNQRHRMGEFKAKLERICLGNVAPGE